MMDEEKQTEEREAQEKPTKETSGEYLFRVLRPAGCIAVLLLFIAYLVFCFTYKSDPKDVPLPVPPAAEETAEQS